MLATTPLLALTLKYLQQCQCQQCHCDAGNDADAGNNINVVRTMPATIP